MIISHWKEDADSISDDNFELVVPIQDDDPGTPAGAVDAEVISVQDGADRTPSRNL